VKKWSIRHDWVNRCLQWDRHIQAQRDRVAASEAAKWERRRLLACERNWDLSVKLDEKIDEMLAFPLATEKLLREGKVVHVYPAKWNYGSIALLARTLADLRAAALMAMTRPIDEYSDSELAAIRDAHDVPEAAGEPGPA
jgi:hypothetical protein